MAFLGKGRRADLILLAEGMGISVPSDARVQDIKELITASQKFDEPFLKEQLLLIIEERIETEKIKESERNNAFELEKLRLQLEMSKLETSGASATVVCNTQTPFNLQKLMPSFDPKEDDMSLFLNLFERQLKFLKVEKEHWVVYLLGVLPHDIAQLIAREPEGRAQDFDHIKEILLKRFKLNAERLRQLFSTHRKLPEDTWKDFSFTIRSYFESWLDELQVTDFPALKDLWVLDQLKRKVPPETKSHFLDVWGEWTTPDELVDKLDSYDNVRMQRRQPPVSSSDSKPKKPVDQRKNYPPRVPKQTGPRDDRQPNSGVFNKTRRDPNHNDRAQGRSADGQGEDRPPVTCYGCGAPGVIKAKCKDCNPARNQTSMTFGTIQLHSLDDTDTPATIAVTVNGIHGTACADSGASHTIAGELLYHTLLQEGVEFAKEVRTVTLADGRKEEREVHSTFVTLQMEGRTFKVALLAFPDARDNRTLLGANFLKKAGIVLNLRGNNWHFTSNPRRHFHFVEPFQLQSCELQNQLETARAPRSDEGKHVGETVQMKNQFIEQTPDITSLAVHTESHPCQLREDEGTSLSTQQQRALENLLKTYERCFQPGGEPTPFAEHRINTGDQLPVAVPPYRMNPAKKELLKTEIDKLLEDGIIEECESPYASPVVLIPKPNGKVRLCVDYRKLNSQTVADSYPLPRMDDLLHEAKPTSFMTTIDLRSGYHQVPVHPEDQDKTAFVCPFGTFRFLRMPFGLKNAPATFQRMIDRFRNGLEDILTLTYLDDIIILSETFEKHLSDLQAVFERLLLFKLTANRAKCHFASSRVKYLGFWITKKGIEVDQEKVSAIQRIPPPKNIKEVQSFLQTCSWFRRYIQDFAAISRPLSDLTKKKVPWKWELDQQQAFETLKNCLITPPVLKQADGTKPYILRTDASSYALGAVLLQGEGPTEHPIEYASRLLTQAERNYSTTEREALAVVWALKKFRGYVEETEVIVASDHQPLKWLLTLKSPTGRLARWALEIQSFNLKVQYISGKVNVVADMLSRPVCEEEEVSPCEICTIVVADMPARSSKDIRESQLQDDSLKKIIDSFESPHKTEDFANWTERGFLMNQGVLYRYVPEADSEDAQLVIPTHERESIMHKHHDDPMAGHYGEDGTFQRIAKRYYWTGMRKYISEYVKKCPECNRYKASNQKPAGLLRTPVHSQRFEVISIDLFGPLPQTQTGKQWIFIVEDCATKWVELFPLAHATAHECATTLIEDVFMRHGIPRRIISDNGTQFVGAVLQQVCFTLNISQNLIPVYFPQANPVERKNRDLKPRLAILVGDEHDNWSSKLPVIRFSMNTAVCDTTGYTPAFLTYGKELRTVDDVVQNFTTVVENDNFVAEITPYLRKFATLTHEIRERIELKQDQRKRQFDKNRRQAYYAPGDKVWINLHPRSDARNKKTAKFMPKRDGPYQVLTQKSPTTYVIASLDNPSQPLATYHTSALTPFRDCDTSPVAPLRKRGRPPKVSLQEHEAQIPAGATRSVSPPIRPAQKPITLVPRDNTSQTLDFPNPVSLPGRRRSQRGRL